MIGIVEHWTAALKPPCSRLGSGLLHIVAGCFKLILWAMIVLGQQR